MNNKKTINTRNYLILLIFTFIFGIILLVITSLSFKFLIKKLDDETLNQKAKITIGNFIIEDLYILKNNSYELTTTTSNESGRKIIINKINKKIDNINKNLSVLNKGGETSRVIELNSTEKTKLIKNITYKNNPTELFTENIDLYPKLLQLESMIKELEKLLREQEYNMIHNLKENYIRHDKKIKIFYKIIPSFFNRIIENTSKIFYESEKKLKILEQKIEEQKSSYFKSELIIILIIFFIVLTLGYVISRRIHKNAYKLSFQETSTRAILDGQKNIIVVSNGKYMVDANKALIDFFDEYNDFYELKKDHICICDFFENMNNEEFLIEKYKDGELWYEKILNNPKKQYKVAMKKDNSLRYFNIFLNKKDINSNEFLLIITLNDITKDLEIQKELKNLNENLEILVLQKTDELQKLNNSLELKVKEEVEKNRNKDKKLIQQSRFAALGEMLENIAHQWKQPLSIISSIASARKLEMELKMVHKKEIKESFSDIVKHVNFLSQTIEDFRTFFTQENEKNTYNVVETLKNSISLITASYKIDFIDILFDSNDIKEFNLYGHQNELIQVLLNIFNNSKDAFKNKKLKTQFVKVELTLENTDLIIKITDNAGGISPRIINKIFDPYFTTKHKSQGTGIGLYMSKEIIEKHIEGKLQVENKKIFHNKLSYMGACFTIQLPKI